MEEIRLTFESIDTFLQKKVEAGNKPETIVEYRRILLNLKQWMLPDIMMREETLKRWKVYMQSESKLAVRTINRRLAVVNQFLDFLGQRNWQVSGIPLEKGEKAVLYRGEYIRLLQAAKQMNKEKIYFIMKTICVLGVSMREFSQLTVDFIKNGRGEIGIGGNTRQIVVPSSFQKELLAYCGRNDIHDGPIFLSQKGEELHRVTVNMAMKQLCQSAGVAPEKATPSCLRGLYEQTQQELQENISILLLQYYEKLLEADDIMAAWEGRDL
nr:hypothetical protein [uncultured Anaerotignum sp.]